MEQAIHITNLKNLKYFQKGKYQRIYWGVEFCQNLIPSAVDTGNILKFARENSLDFTFVSPFVTEQGLGKLYKIFVWLREQKVKNIEIVVNDWGVLECLNSEFKGVFEIVLGGLLTRQQRDPATKKALEKQPPLAIRGKDGKIRIIVHKLPDKVYQDGIRASYINSCLTQEFLVKFGVQRVELNNLLQGVNLKGIKLKKSIYTPFVNISTTRFCPMETRFQKTYRINVCKRECQKYYDILRNKGVAKIIYKRGNTTFYKTRMDANLLTRINANAGTRMSANVDRVVFQPELPF